MVSEIGLNLSALNNLGDFVLNISNTSSDLLSQIPAQANIATGNQLGFFILIPMFILMAWILTEKSNLQEFGYSDLRGSCLAALMTGLMGITLAQVGWLRNIIPVSMAVMGSVLLAVYIHFYENKGAVD